MKQVVGMVSDLPYAGSLVVEKLDAAMVCAAFDMPTQVLITGDGVYALTANQVSDNRSVEKMLRALPSYEIDKIFACEASLEARGLDSQSLADTVKVLKFSEQQALLADADLVLS